MVLERSPTLRAMELVMPADVLMLNGKLTALQYVLKAMFDHLPEEAKKAVRDQLEKDLGTHLMFEYWDPIEHSEIERTVEMVLSIEPEYYQPSDPNADPIV